VNRKTILLSVAHCLIDLACAALYFGKLRAATDWWTVLLLYNACAFAAQMPMGLLADAWNRNLPFAAVGVMLIALAYPLAAIPFGSAILMGLGNGAFHVGAGLEVLNDSDTRSGPLGLFVSPGAIGLYLGTAYGTFWFSNRWIVYLLLFGTLLLLFGSAADKKEALRSENAPFVLQPSKEAARSLLALFAVVMLRSALGMTKAFSSSVAWAMLPALCVAGGKAAGGFLADRFGMRAVSIVSLVLCSVLLCIPTDGTRLSALLLFNMTMPLTLRKAADLLTGAKGFSFGLLTFALFVGFVPRLLNVPIPTNIVLYAALVLISLGLLLYGLRGERT